MTITIDMEPMRIAMEDFGAAIHAASYRVAELIKNLPPIPPEVRCDYSWLWESQCAHCMGHVADWEEPIKRKVIEP